MPAAEIGRRKNCVFNFSVRLCVRECLFVAKCCRSFSRVCSENGYVIHDILLFFCSFPLLLRELRFCDFSGLQLDNGSIQD